MKQLNNWTIDLIPKKYQPIFEMARPYYEKGRDKEDLHHLVVAWMMKNILKEVDLNEDVMMAAALLHDTGYSQIPPEKIRNYSDKKGKHLAKSVLKDHMKFGVEIAEKILKQLNWEEDKIREVCEIIAVHDGPAIGIPIRTQEGKILKEADILWMTTSEAFWLDVERREGMKPEEWLNNLEHRFTKDKNYTKYLTTNFAKKRVKWFLDSMKKTLSL
jgi:putative nucleotidyltransferase with HDIG domain